MLSGLLPYQEEVLVRAIWVGCNLMVNTAPVYGSNGEQAVTRAFLFNACPYLSRFIHNLYSTCIKLIVTEGVLGGGH